MLGTSHRPQQPEGKVQLLFPFCKWKQWSLMLKTPQWVEACKLLNKDLNLGNLAPRPAPSLPCLETHLYHAWPYGRDQRRVSTIPGNGSTEASWRIEAGSGSQSLRHRDVTTSERCHSTLRWSSSGKTNMLLGREGTEIVAQSLMWRVWELCHVTEPSFCQGFQILLNILKFG